MKNDIIPLVKHQLAKVMGLESEADKARAKKFTRLAGPDWQAAPDRFCREDEKIDPLLLGRFYGENNLKRCALEIRRVEGCLALRFSWKTRDHSTWSDKSQARESNRYHSLVVNKDRIGNKNGLNFRRGPDGRFYLGYKNHMDIVMKKI